MTRVRDDERFALLWSAAYLFFVLASWYVLRPVRDTMGVAGGVENLPRLYLATLASLLVASPLFAALVSRRPRHVFIPLVNRFFGLNLLVFFALTWVLEPGAGVHAGRVFFVWSSVFDLFVVSVAWGFMADLFREEQGRRLFGVIAMGGTLGGLGGGLLTSLLVGRLGVPSMMLISFAFLEAATLCVRRLASRFRTDEARPAPPPTGTGPRGGARTALDALDGIRLLARSPYLAGIALYVLLYTVTSTFLSLEQSRIIAETLEAPAERTAVFAWINNGANGLTLLIQLFFTGRIVVAVGVGLTLALLPLVTAAGFAALIAAPGLLVVGAFQVVRRATNFALSKPAREILYTVVGRDEKYKAKNFIDTFVYRTGDALGASAYQAVAVLLGPGLAAVSAAAIPLSALWVGVGTVLGRAERRRAAASAHAGPMA